MKSNFMTFQDQWEPRFPALFNGMRNFMQIEKT